MPDDLSVAIEQLRTSTQRLNGICDYAARVIRDVEAFLEESHVGLEAHVEVNTAEEEGGSVRVTLSYGRHSSGKFRILVNHIPSWAEDADDVTVRPWSECSREEKLDSLQKLPTLIIELAKQIEERTANAQRILSEVTFELPAPKTRKGGA